MQTITGDSLQEVLFTACNTLLKQGKHVDARGKQTLELHPALIKILNPMKRTLLYPGRGNNPFATLAETIWVFSGSSDITWLNYFLPRAAQYSDDGKTWRAGYGRRLISWRGVDDNGEIVGVNQIYSVINTLKKDPTSRQAVITIWDPAKEEMANLRGGSKDYPCLEGDTIVHSPEGNIKIKDIKVGYPVFCYDEKLEQITIRPIINSMKTGRKRIWKVYLDDGTVIETTKHHLFMKKFREKMAHNKPKGLSTRYGYVEVKDLKAGDSLVPIHYIYYGKPYKFVHLYPKKNWANGHRKKVCRLYWESIKGKIQNGYEIDHIDADLSNDKIENLQCISKFDHDHKTAFERCGKNNPNAKTGTVHSDNIKKINCKLHKSNELINWGKDIIRTYGKLSFRTYRKAIQRQNKYKNIEIEYSFGSFGNFKSAVYNNHKVVKIERTGEFKDVYDIQVKDCHNFFVGSGVLVHNCTNWLHFMIRDNKLDLEVVMRSNDLIFGFSGINVYEFTCLQEWVAKELGVPIGHYYHYASSLHVYEEHFDKLKKLADKHIQFPGLTCFEFYKKTDNSFIETLQYLRDNIYHAFNDVKSSICFPRISNVVFPKSEHARELYEYLLMYCVYKQHSEEKLSDDDLVRYHTEVFNEVKNTDLRIACNWWLFKNLKVDISAKLNYPEFDMQVIRHLEEK